MDEIEITELHDLDVTRQDAVASPASGFRFLVTKAAKPDMDDDDCEDGDTDGDGSDDDKDNAENASKAVLSSQERKALPDSDFALPGRRYPIHDKAHARDALARVAEDGTPEQQAEVRSAVRRRYPGISVGKEEMNDDDTQAPEGTEETSPVEDTAKSETEGDSVLTKDSVQELIKAALAERESAAEKQIELLKSELDVLKATPIPGGPVISATSEQRAYKAKNEAIQKAAYHRRQAEQTSDRELIAYHVAKAREFEAEAK